MTKEVALRQIPHLPPRLSPMHFVRVFTLKSRFCNSTTLNRMSIVFVGAAQLAVFCLVLVAVCLVWVRRKRALRVGKGSFGRKRLRTTEAGFEGNCLKMFHSWMWFMSELGAGALRVGCLTSASAFPLSLLQSAGLRKTLWVSVATSFHS